MWGVLAAGNSKSRWKGLGQQSTWHAGGRTGWGGQDSKQVGGRKMRLSRWLWGHITQALTNPLSFKKYILYILKFDIDFWKRKGHTEREREREPLNCCSTYLRTHWLVLACALTGSLTATLALGTGTLTSFATQPGCDVLFWSDCWTGQVSDYCMGTKAH